MFLRLMSSALTAAALALPLAARAEIPSVPIAEDFTGVSYGIESNGTVVVFAAPRDMGGKLAVCGLVFFDGATSTARAVERQFTEHIRFEIGGKVFKIQTDMFTRYKSQTDVPDGSRAGCWTTNARWNPAFATTPIKMSLGAVTVVH